ncbi:MAG: Scr1 family TA system antitoxin-like transcriptional regulator [Pseudonocardiaceae bacterium]
MPLHHEVVPGPDRPTAAAACPRSRSDAALPNVSLRVLLFRVGLHGSMSGSITLLDFAPVVALRTVYREYAEGVHLVDDQDVV